MADNTTLNPGSSGDVIRTLDRTGTGVPKTEVVQLDLGGGDPNREFLIQAVVPVALDGAQYDDDGNILVAFAPSTDAATNTLQQQQLNAFTNTSTAQNSAAPANVQVAGGVFNNNTGTTAVLTAGNASAIQLDNHGLVLVDHASVNGVAVVAAAAGVATVGVVGNAGAAFDQVRGSAVPANALMVAGGSVAGGTNTTAITVKAASTAAAATDTSLVVQPLVGSHTMNTAAAGTQLVGIVGNAAATLDQANGSAVPTNGLMVGGGSVAGATNFTVLTVKAASTAAAATDTSLVVQPLIKNAVMSVAAAGTQLVGISGATAATLDSVTTAATTPANALAVTVANVTTAPSLATGQSVALQADYQGSTFVKPYRRGQTVPTATTVAVNTVTTIVAAQAAGIFADISAIVITTAGLVAQTITISDGTLSWIIDYPNAAVAPGTPFYINFDPPLKATNAATAWTTTQSLGTTCHYLVNVVLQKAS